MGDGDAEEADLERLEALDDAALARLAYGRADSDTERMLAQRAARILASRRPAPPPAARAAHPEGPTAGRRRSVAPSSQLDEILLDDSVADEDAADDDASRRRSRVLALVGAVLAIAMVGAVIALSLPREPAPFAVFGERVGDSGDPTAANDVLMIADNEYAERLANTGERLLSPARVLASTRLADGGTIDLVAFRSGREGDPAERREVCVALWGTLGATDAQPRRWERACLSEPEFLTTGIEGVLSLTGAEVAYAWPVSTSSADGQPRSPSVTFSASGPTTVGELYELDSIALLTLPAVTEAGASPLVSSIVGVVHPPTLEPIVLGPAELTRAVDEDGAEAILIGYVAPGSLPGSELSVCVVAAELGVARGVIDSRCSPATEFAAVGIGSDQSPNAGVGTFSYRWEPWGDTRLTVLRPLR